MKEIKRDSSPPEILKDYGTYLAVAMGDHHAIMDRDSYDYQYGVSDAPDPAQRDLNDLCARITRIVVKASGMFRGQAMGSEVLIDTSDPAALAAVGPTLRISEDPLTFKHCGCFGGPTLELFVGSERLATIGLQHGKAIRCSLWKHDAQLVDGDALSAWLTTHGVEPEFLRVHYENAYDAGGLRAVGFRRSGVHRLTTAEQRVRLAELKHISGDHQGAFAAVQRELEADPSLALAHAVRALIRYEHGHYESSVTDCSTAIRLGLHERHLFFTRAVALDATGRHQEALDDCNTILKLDPDDAQAYNSRGSIEIRLGMFDQARADLDRAMELKPGWILPYLNRAQLHHAVGAFDAAVADSDRVIDALNDSLRPKDRAVLGTAYWWRAQSNLARGEIPLAELDFAEARRLESTQ